MNGAGVNATKISADLEKLTINDCLFLNNEISRNVYSYGGALQLFYINNASVCDSTFTGNIARTGGAIHLRGGSAVFSGNTIDLNLGNYSGGLFVNDSTVTIENSNIEANGGGEYGGGVFAHWATVSFENTTLMLNNAGESGGGVYANQATVTIQDSTILINNAGESGGGVYGENAVVTITNSNISDNINDNSGGGVYAKETTLTITDSTISNNIGAHYGGGVYTKDSELTIEGTIIRDHTASVSGGGVYADNSTLTIINNFFKNDDNLYVHSQLGYVWDDVFNRTLLLKTNIVGGRYSGGNAWANQLGTGFSETCTDANLDGICDGNFTITDDQSAVIGTDELPLVYPPPSISSESNAIGSGYNSDISVGVAYDLKAGEPTVLVLKKNAVTQVRILPAVDIPELMVTVERKSGPDRDIEPPDTKIYQYEKVTLYKADVTEITNITYTFKISNDWLAEQNVLPALWQYNKTSANWTGYSTTITGNDAYAMTSEATCPGVGWIAFGGEAGAPLEIEEIVIDDSGDIPIQPEETAIVYPTYQRKERMPVPVTEAKPSPPGVAGLLIGLGAAALLRHKFK